ncbi:hypothetical protein C2845_PM06G29080 [Panicum miliaceum]|uniref:Uncharacterized protein n=1 Tax=Panicum miliaceum TaxID=4540 RepID=A0A3L6RAF8_PANMI|nr:hypothetical protein C2845_PM06G29080 [Panicum miliaceum]
MTSAVVADAPSTNSRTDLIVGDASSTNYRQKPRHLWSRSRPSCPCDASSKLRSHRRDPAMAVKRDGADSWEALITPPHVRIGW